MSEQPLISPPPPPPPPPPSADMSFLEAVQFFLDKTLQIRARAPLRLLLLSRMSSAPRLSLRSEPIACFSRLQAALLKCTSP